MPAAIAKNAAERIAEFDVRTGSAGTAAGTLSGGNQQKVILARELGRLMAGGADLTPGLTHTEPAAPAEPEEKP